MRYFTVFPLLNDLTQTVNTLKTGRFTISNDALVNTFQNILTTFNFIHNVIVFLVNRYTAENTVDEYARRQSSKC